MKLRTNTPSFFNSFKVLSSAFALSALAVVGCGDDDSGGSSSAATGGTGAAGGMGGTGGMAGTGGTSSTMAMLRIVHAAPTAPAVDIYPAGSTTPVAQNVEYGKATPYLELPPGMLKVDIRAAGAAATDAPAFTTPDITLEADKKYTAIAAGDLGSTSADDQFRVLPFEEGFAQAASGNARVRIVHASFDAPTVGVDVGNDDPAAPEVAALDRFADTGANGIDLPAGQKLQVGIAAGGSTVTAFTTPELTDGADVFIVATGQLSKVAREESGFSLLAVLPDSATAWVRQNPRVYALHTSPDAGNVDIYAGTTELVDNAGFGAMAPLQVPPGTYTLEFFPGQAGATPKPSGSPAASATTPALEAGQSYLAIAAGELTASPPTFSLIAVQEGFDLADSSNGRVRAVHASGNAPKVDIGPASAGNLTAALFSGVSFEDASDAAGASVAPGNVTLGVAGATTTSTVAEFPISITAGSRSIAVAAGALGGNTNAFRLMVIDTTASPWTKADIANAK